MTQPPDGGFTLAEALVALLIISLALAGAMQAGRMVGAYQKRLAADRKSEAARLAFAQALSDRLGPLQPIEDDVVTGDAHGLRYACADDAQGCRLDAPRGTLVYASGGVGHATWPIAAAPVRFDRPRLEAIIWRDGRGQNLAVVRFTIEQPRTCIFDMISRACLSPEASAAAS